MLGLTKKLVKPVCVPGCESEVTEVIKGEISPYVDECRIDRLGNLICLKKGTAENAKKVMFAAHIDEIGFIVTSIDDKGYVKFSTLGGINMTAASYSVVEFASGLTGVIVPNADAGSPLNAENCSVDIGAKTKKDAERRVKVGDTFSVKSDVVKLANNRISGRPLDDRIGAVVLIEAAKRVDSAENDVYFCFTVQEEVGCRGSKTAAYQVQPDVGIALDVTGTGDCVNSHPMEVSLGGGAAVKIKDSSVVCDRSLVELMKKTAVDGKIRHQMEVLVAGGTDTSSMQQTGSGAVAGCISIPTRYIHSPVEEVDLGDVEECVKLTAALAKADYSEIL